MTAKRCPQLWPVLFLKTRTLTVRCTSHAYSFTRAIRSTRAYCTTRRVGRQREVGDSGSLRSLLPSIQDKPRGRSVDSGLGVGGRDQGGSLRLGAALITHAGLPAITTIPRASVDSG